MHTSLRLVWVTVLVALLLVAAVVGSILYTPSLYAALIKDHVLDRYGYEISIGNVNATLWPAEFQFRNVVARDPAQTDLEIVTVEHAVFRVDLLDALQHHGPYWSASIEGVTLYAPTGFQVQRTRPPPSHAPPARPSNLQRLSFEEILVENVKIYLGHSARPIHLAAIEAVRDDENRIRLDATGSYDQAPIVLGGAVAWSDSTDPRIHVNIDMVALGMSVRSTGSLDIAGGTDVTISVKGKSLQGVQDFLSITLPDITPIDVELQLTSRDSSRFTLLGAGLTGDRPLRIDANWERLDLESNTSVYRLDLEADLLGAGLIADGTINVADWRSGSELAIQLSADDLTRWNNSVGALSPLELTTTIKTAGNTISIPSLALSAGQGEIAGAMRYAFEPPHLTADLRSDGMDLTPFIENTTPTHRAGGNIVVDEFWPADAEADIGLQVSRLVLGKHVIDGFATRLKLADSVLKIAPMNGTYRGNAEHDAAVPLQLTGAVRPVLQHGSDEYRMRIDLNLSSDASFDAALTGTVTLDGIDGTQLDLRASATDLDALAKALGAPLTQLAPLELTATLKGEDRIVSIDPLSIAVQGNDVSGNATLNWSADRPVAAVRLEARKLDVDNFRPAAEVRELVGQNTSPAAGPKKVFSDEPFDLTWLDDFDLALSAQIETLTINQTTFRNVNSEVTLRDGALTMNPLTADLVQGGVDGLLSLHRDGDLPEVIARFSARNLSPADLGNRGEGVIDGGNTDVFLVVNAKGSSASALAASLDGEIAIQIQQATVRNDTFESFGSDLLIETLTMINPFIENDEHTQLECATFRFLAKDGILTTSEQIAIQTAKVKIVGSGIVNLKTEQLEIGFTPVAREGIGVNVSSLVKFARLGGTLSDPRVEGDPVGYLKTGAAIGAAISTAGVSLLVEGLFKRATSGGSVCEDAAVTDATQAPAAGRNTAGQ